MRKGVIKAVMKVVVQEVCFTTVRSDRNVVIPKSRDSGVLFVEHLDSLPEFFLARKLQIVKVLFFVPM